MGWLETTSRLLGTGALLASSQLGLQAEKPKPPTRPDSFVSYQLRPHLPPIQKDHVSVIQLITKPEMYAGKVISLTNVVAVPGVQNEITHIYPPGHPGQPQRIVYNEIAYLTDAASLKAQYPYSEAIRILNLNGLRGKPNYEPHLADYVKFNIEAKVDTDTASSGDAGNGLVNLTALAIQPVAK